MPLMILFTFLNLAYGEFVDLKTKTSTYNERYKIKLENEKVYIKELDDNQFEPLPLPKKYRDLKFKELAADNRYIVLITKEGDVLKTKSGRKGLKSMKWDMLWGHPFGKGKGFRFQPNYEDWDIQDWDMFKDKYIVHPTNGEHYRTISIAHLFQIHNGRTKVTVHDPFLPAKDLSYEMCLPHHGNSKVQAFSSSGGFVFLMDQKGELYTRLWNLDIAGYNQYYASYKYEIPVKEVKRRSGVFQFFRKIILPSPEWVKQPLPPGKITNGISIVARGEGTIRADLIVEGFKNEQVGLWRKDINDQVWEFYPTQKQRAKLATVDNNILHLKGKEYSAISPEFSVLVKDFKPQCSPSKLIIRSPNNGIFELKIHLRGLYRLKEFSDSYGPSGIKMRGAIEFPSSIPSEFIKLLTNYFGYKGKPFVEVKAFVNQSRIEIQEGIPSPIILEADSSTTIK